MKPFTLALPLHCALVGVSLLAACGGPAPDATDTQEIETSTSGVTYFPDYCKTSSPDATLTMGPGVFSVSSTSPDGGYTYKQDGCSRWVVDVNVPYDSNYGSSYYKSISVDTGAVGLAGGATEYSDGYSEPSSSYGQAYCESYAEYVRVYKKPSGAREFSQVDSWITRGVWNSAYSYCDLQDSPRMYGMTPPTSGTDVYRFAVSVKVDDVFRKVGVKAWHPAIIH